MNVMLLWARLKLYTIVALVVLALAVAVWQAPRLQLLLAKAGPTRLITVAIGLVFIALWRIPKIQVAPLKAQGVPPDRLAELEDKARATLAQVIGGALFLVTAYCTWQGIADTREAQRRQFDIAVSGQVTERFMRWNASHVIRQPITGL